MFRPIRIAAAAVLLAASGTVVATASPSAHPSAVHQDSASGVRVATFNASLNRRSAGELITDLSEPGNAQASAIAEIIQRTAPDVILLNEFDYDADGAALAGFAANYLGVSQNGAEPIAFEHTFAAPSNTGVPSGHDLDNNGTVGGPGDAFGFGFFEGQYGMAILSKYPIDTAGIRTFGTFLWKDMPGALLPDDPATPEPNDWYSAEELADVRLSSKSHWDVPVQLPGKTVHVLASHPTPPVFDGPEDRNGKRNHDEIRFWADYISPGKSDYIYDDEGQRGGIACAAHYVIAGDLNADLYDGDSTQGAVSQLFKTWRVMDPRPASAGGVEAAQLQGGANDTHRGNPAYDTADFSDRAPGNLRVDYVLPSPYLPLAGSGVFWPEKSNPLSRLTGTYPFPSSDHRLVYIDLAG